MSSRAVTIKDIEIVLRLLGKDPQRLAPYSQDAQYLCCRVDELGEYIDLYVKQDTPDSAKHVLCCFMLQCLNSTCDAGHPLEKRILHTLFQSRELHAEELEYWMDTSEPDEENWWPITRILLEYQRRHSTQPAAVDDDRLPGDVGTGR